MSKIDERIEELLNRLDAAESDDEILALGRALLASDPKSPYGKLAVWESLGYEESISSLDMLKEALDEIRAVVESREAPAFIEDDRDSQTYCSILMNLGYSLLTAGETEEALDAAKELANFDDEGCYPSRELLYRCLLDLDMYDEILETLETDPVESVVGEHARAIALIETGAGREEISGAINYAVSLSPDVPFLVLGIWEFPEEEDDDLGEYEETVLDATYLCEPWSRSDRRLSLLSIPVFLLGYLTERIDDRKEIEALRQTYEAAGILKDVEESRTKIAKMINRNEDPEEVDACAMGELENLLEKMFDGVQEL